MDTKKRDQEIAEEMRGKPSFKPDPPEMVPMPMSDTHEVWVSFEGVAKVYVTAKTDEAAVEEACDNCLARGKVTLLEITATDVTRLRENTNADKGQPKEI